MILAGTAGVVLARGSRARITASPSAREDPSAPASHARLFHGKPGSTPPLVMRWSRAALRVSSVLAAVVVLAWPRRPLRAEPSLVLDTSPAGDRALLVPGSDARGAHTLRAHVALDHALQPLVVIGPDATAYPVLERQTFVAPGVSFALAHRFLFALEAPVLVSEEAGWRPFGAPVIGTGKHGPGLGDLELSARARLLGASDAAVKGSARVDAWLPTGKADFAGDGALRARPAVAMEVTTKRARAALEAGFVFRRRSLLPALLPVRTGSALTTGVAAGLTVDRHARFEVGGEVALSLAAGGGARLLDPRSTAGQALLSLRTEWKPLPLSLTLAGGPGLGQGPGAADVRVLARITYSPEEPPPPPDGDGDGIPDLGDACPRVRGVSSGDPMMHGCPELPTDTDGDTIPDMRDACPKRPGLGHLDRKLHGCPPAPPPPPPAPPPAPPPPRATLVEQQIVITEQVQFETNTAVIRPESDSLLEEVAGILRAHPELVRVEVQGHTDSTGTPELNRRLSDERARAVMSWLVTRGIDPGRLGAVGYGETVPLGDNATDEGRTKNRRVEFRILEQKREAAP
jgi:OOP family OmpA-OmpF porin